MELLKDQINKGNTQKMIKALDNAINILEKNRKQSHSEDIQELLNLMFQLIEVS